MLISAGTKTLGPIIGGRVLAGFGIGGASNLVPIYISELAPPAVRGRLVGLYELGWQFGGLVGFWICYGINLHIPPTSARQWIIPFALQLVPGGLLLVGAFWLRESPRWLYSKGRRDEGLKNLLWIRQLPSDDIYIIEDVAGIDAAIAEQNGSYGSGFWAPFKALGSSRKVQWRFFLGGMLFLWQNASGINAINYYSPTIFKTLGISGTNTGFLTTGLFGVVKTVCTFIWLLFLIDRLGRRNLLLFGAAGGSVCMWVISAITYTHPHASSTVSATTTSGNHTTSVGVAGIFFFYLWSKCLHLLRPDLVLTIIIATFYSPSWNGTVWVINAEFFDATTRSLGQANAAMNNWFWNFIVSRFTPNMFDTMGPGGSGVYMFFASLMLISIVFVYFLIPETKGVPLEAMDRLFEIKPVRKAHATVLAELQKEDIEFRRTASVAGLDAADEKAMERVEHMFNEKKMSLSV